MSGILVKIANMPLCDFLSPNDVSKQNVSLSPSYKVCTNMWLSYILFHICSISVIGVQNSLGYIEIFSWIFCSQTISGNEII